MALGAPAGLPQNAQPQFPFSLSGWGALPPKSHFFFKPCVAKVPFPHFTRLPHFTQLPHPGVLRGAGGHLRVLGVPHRKWGGNTAVCGTPTAPR